MRNHNHRRDGDDFDMPPPPPPSPGDESLLMSLIEIATDLQSGSGEYYNSDHDVSDLFDSFVDLDDMSLLSEINNVSFDSFLDTLRSEAGRKAIERRTGGDASLTLSRMQKLMTEHRKFLSVIEARYRGKEEQSRGDHRGPREGAAAGTNPYASRGGSVGSDGGSSSSSGKKSSLVDGLMAWTDRVGSEDSPSSRKKKTSLVDGLMELFQKGSDRLRPISEEDEMRNSDRSDARRVDGRRGDGTSEADPPPHAPRGRRRRHQPPSAPGRSAFLQKSNGRAPSAARGNKQTGGMSDRIVELEDDRPKRMIDIYDLQYPGDLSVDGSQMSFGGSQTDLSLSCGTKVSLLQKGGYDIVILGQSNITAPETDRLKDSFTPMWIPERLQKQYNVRGSSRQQHQVSSTGGGGGSNLQAAKDRLEGIDECCQAHYQPVRENDHDIGRQHHQMSGGPVDGPETEERTDSDRTDGSDKRVSFTASCRFSDDDDWRAGNSENDDEKDEDFNTSDAWNRVHDEVARTLGQGQSDEVDGGLYGSDRTGEPTTQTGAYAKLVDLFGPNDSILNNITSVGPNVDEDDGSREDGERRHHRRSNSGRRDERMPSDADRLTTDAADHLESSMPSFLEAPAFDPELGTYTVDRSRGVQQRGKQLDASVPSCLNEPTFDSDLGCYITRRRGEASGEVGEASSRPADPPPVRSKSKSFHYDTGSSGRLPLYDEEDGRSSSRPTRGRSFHLTVEGRRRSMHDENFSDETQSRHSHGDEYPDSGRARKSRSFHAESDHERRSEKAGARRSSIDDGPERQQQRSRSGGRRKSHTVHAVATESHSTAFDCYESKHRLTSTAGGANAPLLPSSPSPAETRESRRGREGRSRQRAAANAATQSDELQQRFGPPSGRSKTPPRAKTRKNAATAVRSALRKDQLIDPVALLEAEGVAPQRSKSPRSPAENDAGWEAYSSSSSRRRSHSGRRRRSDEGPDRPSRKDDGGKVSRSASDQGHSHRELSVPSRREKRATGEGDSENRGVGRKKRMSTVDEEDDRNSGSSSRRARSRSLSRPRDKSMRRKTNRSSSRPSDKSRRDRSASSDARRHPLPQDAEISPGALTPDQIAEVERRVGSSRGENDSPEHSIGRRSSARSLSTRSGRSSELRSSLQSSRSSSSSQRRRKSSSVPRKKSQVRRRHAPERGARAEDLDDLAARIVSEELDKTRRRGRSCGRVRPGLSDGGERSSSRSRGPSEPRRRGRSAHRERKVGAIGATEHAVCDDWRGDRSGSSGGRGRGRGTVPASKSLHSEAKELFLAGNEGKPSRSKSDSTSPTETSDLSSGEDIPRGRRVMAEKKSSRWSVRGLVGRRRSSDT